MYLDEIRSIFQKLFGKNKDLQQLLQVITPCISPGGLRTALLNFLALRTTQAEFSANCGNDFEPGTLSAVLRLFKDAQTEIQKGAYPPTRIAPCFSYYEFEIIQFDERHKGDEVFSARNVSDFSVCFREDMAPDGLVMQYLKERLAASTPVYIHVSTSSPAQRFRYLEVSSNKDKPGTFYIFRNLSGHVDIPTLTKSYATPAEALAELQALAGHLDM